MSFDDLESTCSSGVSLLLQPSERLHELSLLSKSFSSVVDARLYDNSSGVLFHLNAQVWMLFFLCAVFFVAALRFLPSRMGCNSKERGLMADLWRHCSVMQAGWTVVQCSCSARFSLCRGRGMSGDVTNARFCEANILRLEFQFFHKNELLKFSRKQFDKTVFLNDSNCFLTVNLFGRNCPSRFFSDGRMRFRIHFWWALNFHDLFVTRPFLVDL